MHHIQIMSSYGGLNGHVGQDRDGMSEAVDTFSVGNRNRDGERVIQFCSEHNMSIMNTYIHQE